MSSKMREALQKAYRRGFSHAREGRLWLDFLENADEIISHYGDLEFTREDVRGMLEEAYKFGRNDERNGFTMLVNATTKHLLSRHTEAAEMKQAAREDARESFESRREALERGFRGEAGDVSAKAHRDLYHSMNAETEDETPTIKASEIERQTGEKVPEWARWAAYSEVGPETTVIYENRPSCYYPGERWESSGGLTHVLPKEVIHPHRYYLSLRRIIHDEPEQPYWLCCGSTARLHDDERARWCRDIQNRKWGTRKDHAEPTTASEVMLDTRPKVTRGELLEKRVAAIEKRVLFEGHAQNCEKRLVGQPGVMGARDICTCHYDEIQEGRPHES